MPRTGLRLTLKSSPLLYRLAPRRLVVKRAVRRGQKLWDADAAARANAVETMQIVVAGTSRAAEVSELAREHLIEDKADVAIFWQPWLAPDLDAPSDAAITAALSAGRGVVISACHLAGFYLVPSAFVPRGHRPYCVIGPWMFGDPPPGYAGRRLTHYARCANRTTRPIAAKGSFGVLMRVLSAGESVYILFDLPGRRATRFLGKPAMLADGTARLAVAADALVLAVRTRRVGHRVALDAAPALDPRDFAGSDDLHDALIALHQQWILQTPAAMTDPRTFDWGDGASAERWVAPGGGDGT